MSMTVAGRMPAASVSGPGLVQRLRASFAGVSAYRRTRNELSGLTSRDLFDIGIDPGSIEDIARHSASQARDKVLFG